MAAPPPIAVRGIGTGPPAVLVHGGLGPEITWELQEPLAQRWSLIIPWRRGYAPSPPAERHDFEPDAEDISRLLEEPAHLVGFSYGGLGVAIAAGRQPDRVRSLTLVETPLWKVAQDDPEVERMATLGERFAADPQGEQGSQAEFLAIAGIDLSGPVSEQAQKTLELARNLRSPREADADLDTIVEAGVPAMVVSGGHQAGIEAVCDAIAARLQGKRICLTGKGHAVPRTPEFNSRLEEFWLEAEAGRAAG